MTLHNLLFCPHILCISYITNTFPLVSSSVRSKQLLCFVHRQGQKSKQKPTTKTLVGFHKHSPSINYGQTKMLICTVELILAFLALIISDFCLFQLPPGWGKNIKQEIKKGNIKGTCNQMLQ